MLKEISIKNLGIIERASVEFQKGFTVITGETGAGKTMLLTGVNLLLGKRANTNSIKDGETKAIVNGVYEVESQSTEDLIESIGADLEDDKDLYITRTVTADNKNITQIGGVRTPVKTLSIVGNELVAIHGQSDQLFLRDPEKHLVALDEYASLNSDTFNEALKSYRKSFFDWLKIDRKVKDYKKNHFLKVKEKEVYEEFVKTFEELDVSKKRVTELESTVKRLSNVDKIKEELNAAIIALNPDEYDTEVSYSIFQILENVSESLSKISNLDSELKTFSKDFDNALDSIANVEAGLQSYLNRIDSDDLEELYSAQEDLDQIEKFIKKNGGDIDEVIQRFDEYVEKIKELEVYDTPIDELEEELSASYKNLLKKETELLKERKTVAVEFSKKVNQELKELSMAGNEFLINFVEGKKATQFGFHSIEFMLKYPDSSPKSISASASGGELSRIMLALEVVKASENFDKTFIFDEIDAGIGGETAISVGRCLEKLSKRSQVIVVTHLPQVAAFADEHFVITKRNSNNVVSTDVSKILTESSQIKEITRMLSGLTDSEAGQIHAKELLSLKQ